jgi:hypothetical protein
MLNILEVDSVIQIKYENRSGKGKVISATGRGGP